MAAANCVAVLLQIFREAGRVQHFNDGHSLKGEKSRTCTKREVIDEGKNKKRDQNLLVQSLNGLIDFAAGFVVVSVAESLAPMAEIRRDDKKIVWIRQILGQQPSILGLPIRRQGAHQDGDNGEISMTGTNY